VQAEIARRNNLGRPVSCQSPFSTKIKCGCCGGWFGSKVWQSNTKYRTIIWRCNDRYNSPGERKCETAHIREDEVKEKFLTAFNQLMKKRDGLIEDCRQVQKMLCDTAAIETEMAELEREIEVVEGLVKQAIHSNAREVIDQAEWTERNEGFLNRHTEATSRLEELNRQKAERLGRSKTIEVFINNLECSKQVITDFDDNLWAAVVDYVSVGVDGKLTFIFKNGAQKAV
jgi:hypothetical protein